MCEARAGRRDAAGFTLLEVMIALAIMSGVILTVITSFNYHLDLVSRGREETDAVLLARAKLDEAGFAPLEKAQGTFAPERPEMSWTTETAPTELPGLVRLTLTVSWGEGKRTLSLVKYVQK
ncbi:MAG TPA: prepilin-type N-terminal cleavage/methylation domain-containing protein [Geobacteraceae bacterium]